MKKEMKIKFKMIISLIGMLCSVLVLTVSFAYAWFSANRDVDATSMKVSVSNPNKMFFVDVDATKYSLDNSKIVNHYDIKDDTLVVSSSISYDASGNEDSTYENTNTSFMFDEILPGEYVEVTINYYLDDSLSGSEYYISLYDFSSSGIFQIEVDSGDNAGTYNYYVAGAFKYKPLKSTFYSDTSKSTIASELEYSDDYKFISTYEPFTNEALPESVDFENLTWLSSYKMASFTFEIKEDISQFYDLINKSGAYYSNLLSEKALMINSLRIVVDK